MDFPKHLQINLSSVELSTCLSKPTFCLASYCLFSTVLEGSLCCRHYTRHWRDRDVVLASRKHSHGLQSSVTSFFLPFHVRSPSYVPVYLTPVTGTPMPSSGPCHGIPEDIPASNPVLSLAILHLVTSVTCYGKAFLASSLPKCPTGSLMLV